MTVSLALIWALIIGFCIVMYVILDGFTLGTGLLMPFMTVHERDLSLSVILPTWDGNQTWLVMGTAGLYGAFPIAFSLLLPALYLPLLLMAIALLFRGIAFEFRLKTTKNKFKWSCVFIGGSLVTTVLQGMILGNFVEGFKLYNGSLTVLNSGFISYFSVFTAVSLVLGYSLLSATRLILKTEGALQAKAYQYAKFAVWGVMIASFIVSIWSPFINQQLHDRWLNVALWPYLAPLPILNGLAFIALLFALKNKNEILPYWLSVMVFIFPFLGFVISIYPYIIPYQMPYWAAAAPHNTLLFIFVGASIMLPILLLYTYYAYHIFKGKVKDVIAY